MSAKTNLTTAVGECSGQQLNPRMQSPDCFKIIWAKFSITRMYAIGSFRKRLCVFGSNLRLLHFPWSNPDKFTCNNGINVMIKTDNEITTKQSSTVCAHILHYSDVIMSTVTLQITGVFIVCKTVRSGADQRKRQSSASLAFVRGIHRWPGNSPHKGPATRKMFPFDYVIMTGHTPCSMSLPCATQFFTCISSSLMN